MAACAISLTLTCNKQSAALQSFSAILHGQQGGSLLIVMAEFVQGPERRGLLQPYTTTIGTLVVAAT